MIKAYLEIGQVGTTHGVKGEFRLNPWCDGPEFVKKFKTLYCDAQGNKPMAVISCRPHGNVCILKIDGINTIEQAQALKGKVLYMKRSDINLPKGKWFISELIGCEVFDADDESKLYGTLSDVSYTGANDVWHIESNGTEYLIPAIPPVVIETDVESNRILIRPLKGIFDDAD